ncbi:hypothetical protein L9F63_011771, partial [Diploptera punctata]
QSSTSEVRGNQNTINTMVRSCTTITTIIRQQKELLALPPKCCFPALHLPSNPQCWARLQQRLLQWRQLQLEVILVQCRLHHLLRLCSWHISLRLLDCCRFSCLQRNEFIWSAKLNDAERLSAVSIPQPSPLPLPLSPTWEVLQETTARLLFMAVRWVRCLAPFQTLSKRDQLLLLQESWKELFLLHLAQWSIPWDLSALFGCSKARDRLPQDDVTNNEIKTIQEIMGRFRQLSPDGSECGCMKRSYFLLRVKTVGLCDVQPVEMLQDQAQCILGDYVRSRYPRQPTRFGRLLLLLPSLRAVRQATVEQLFFKETIGEIPIQRLLGDMYHMEKYTVVFHCPTYATPLV